MGRHERWWAEEAEKNVTNALNQTPSTLHDNQIAASIREHISQLFSEDNITQAKWVGAEDYADKGDLHVYLESGTKCPVELKVSKKSGSGTKGNTTTNVIKKYFGQDKKSYPELDEELGLLRQRYDLVESYTGAKISSSSVYQKTLREIRKNTPSLLDTISSITEPGQQQYAEYVSDLMNDNLSQTSLFVKDILGGNNTSQDAAHDNDLVYCVVKHYQTNKQTVDFYDLAAVDHNVHKVVASGKSIKIQNKYGVDILRMSVTWKNICQGGATPCFNIFLGDVV